MSRVATGLRLAVTLVALAAVIHLLGAQAIWAQLRAASPLWIGLAVAALSAQILLSALRWRLTAGALGLALSRATAVREYYLAVLGNTLLPGGVLGDASRIARMRHLAGLGRAAESVVIERLAGQVALGAAAALGAAIWLWPDRLAVTLAGVVLLALAGLAVALGRLRPAAGPPAWLRRTLFALRRAWLEGGIWRRQLALSLAILACNAGGFWAAAQATGIDLPPAAALFVIPLTLSAMLLPVSINGWGLREAAAAALWPLAGVLPAEAVAASVIFGVAALVAALPGLLALQPQRALRP